MNYYINDELCCVTHLKSDWKAGLDFVTRDTDFVQAGTWWYESGKVLDKHYHNAFERVAELTQEVVIVISGKLEVYLFDGENKKVQSFILESGDFGVFLAGGHGYKIIEDDTRVIEVKNGPFAGVEKDKTKF